MKKLRYIFKVNSGLLVLVMMLTCFFANAQNKPILVDEVVAVIGKNAIFKSDIDAAVTQLQMQGAPADFSTSCYVLQERLFEKLNNLTENIIESISILIDKKLDLFSSTVNNK